jgi:hypothetical protein
MLDRLFNSFIKPSAVPQGLAIPHPEERRNPSATLANTNTTAIITKWLQDWGVPAPHWDYWRTAIDVQVYDIYPDSLISKGLKHDTPAATWDEGGKRHLAIKAQWLNPGVIAHEQAHNSYALLSNRQKAVFSSLYNSLKNTDPLIRHLYSINAYGLTNDIEGHAEVYRYIGQHMPVQLKYYYPKLFESSPGVNKPEVNQEQVSGKKAKIIPEPQAGTRSVIDQKTLPVAVSSGDTDILCGSCGVVLIKGMLGDSFSNIVIRCPRCGKFNEM